MTKTHIPEFTEVTNDTGGSFHVDLTQITWFCRQIDKDTGERKDIGINIGIHAGNHLECDRTTINDLQRAINRARGR